MKINLITYHCDNTGIGKYSQKLFQYMLDSNSEVDLTHFNYHYREIRSIRKDKTITIKKDRAIPFFDNYLLFGFRNRKILAKSKDYDINHILTHNLSIIQASPKVITCHDIIPYLFPQSLSHSFFRSLKYRGLREADAIIAISDRTKEDLINYFRILESKVYRVYQGVDFKFQWSDDDLDSLITKFNLPRNKRYILFVGAEISRKNFKTAIKAFARVMMKERDIHLIKVGNGRYSYRKHYNLIKNLGLEKNITFIEYVNNLDLEGLYSLSELFVFPSLYEGFGLPPLEAMACGTPVITSNTSSLPEVVGDAGIMVNPYDVDELAEAMERVLDSENLQKELIRKGLERAKQFSWERTAKETLKVYMDVLNKV